MNAYHIVLIGILVALLITSAMIARAVQVSSRIQRGDW